MLERHDFVYIRKLVALQHFFTGESDTPLPIKASAKNYESTSRELVTHCWPLLDFTAI